MILKTVFSFNLKMSIHCPYVCIHIRRRDCTPTAHPKWFFLATIFISNLYRQYSNLIQLFIMYVSVLKARLAGSNSKIVESDRFIVRSTNQLFINDSEVEDFVLMKEADILFSASSSFSYWATIIGSHRLVFDITRLGTHPLKNAKTVNPDININSSITKIKNPINQCLQ